MKRLFTLTVAVFALLFSSFGQTTLSPGDLVVVNVNADGSDNFDFIPLIDLQTGTVINFTDNAWNGTSFRTGEGIKTWTAAANVSKGTVVSFSGVTGGEWTSSGSYAIANSGDNLLVYQGSAATPTFLYGVGWASASPWVFLDNANTSEIPSALTLNSTAIYLGALDNYQYNGPTSGTAAQLLDFVSNPANWVVNDAAAYSAYPNSFTITATETLVYSVNFSVTGSNGTISATVDGNAILNGADIEGGKDVVFTATPAVDYQVADWTLNTTPLSNTNTTYTLSTLAANAIVTVEFELIPTTTTYDVTFTVTDGANPIVGAAVTVGTTTVNTDATGVAVFNLIDGNYTYGVTATGYDAISSVAFSVSGANLPIAVSMSLTPVYAVTFTVTDGTNPIVGAAVTVGTTTVNTDATGVAVFNLVDGNYTYGVTATGYDAISSVAFVVAGANLPIAVTMSLTPVYAVTFTVTDGANPIVGAAVTVGTTTVNTDATGVAVFNLVDGNYTYGVTATGYDAISAVAFTVNGANLPIAVSMSLTPVSYAVTFTVTDGTNPIVGAAVTVGTTTVNTDATGVAVFNLIDGNYTYGVTATGYDAISSVAFAVAGANLPIAVTMTLTPVTYTVTFSVTGANGTLVAEVNSTPITSGDAVVENSEVLFTATPTPGYQVKDWTLNATPLTLTSTTYTIASLTANADVTVEFELIPPTTIVEWTFPNNPDDSIADGGITANLNKIIYCNSGDTATFTSTGATTFSARADKWNAGMDTKYWVVEFTTLGYQNIKLSSKQRSSNTGPKDFKAQYSLDSLNWVDIANVTVAANWTSGVLPTTALPSETMNKPSVWVRWIMTSNVSANSGTVASAGASNIDDIIVTGDAYVSNEAEIITFDIPLQNSSVVNSTDATVFVEMPIGTDVTMLTPDITISYAATISPLSGVQQNFFAPVVYTVTAQDGTEKDWTVTVTIASELTENISSNMLVYPNPSNGTVYVRTNTPAHIIVLSVDGRVVAENNEASVMQTIDLSHVAKGVYMIKVIEGNVVSDQKLVIE